MKEILRRSLDCRHEPAHLRRLADYYDPEGEMVGASLTDLPHNDWNDITAADLHAAALVGTSIGPRATRRLLIGPERTWVIESLKRIPNKELSFADPETLERMWEFHGAVEHALSPERQPVRSSLASTLAARKRPELFPVRDSAVRARLGLARTADARNDWLVFRALLQEPEILHGLRQLEDALIARGVRNLEHNLLRLLDAMLRVTF